MRLLLFAFLWVGSSGCAALGFGWAASPLWNFFFRFRVLKVIHELKKFEKKGREAAYVVENIVIFIVVFHILKIIIILLHHVVFQSFAGEVVDGFGDDLLLDVLADLIVHLELLLQFVEFIFCHVTVVDGLLGGWCGWREEVEEGLCGTRFSDESCAVCVWKIG